MFSYHTHDLIVFCNVQKMSSTRMCEHFIGIGVSGVSVEYCAGAVQKETECKSAPHPARDRVALLLQRNRYIIIVLWRPSRRYCCHHMHAAAPCLQYRLVVSNSYCLEQLVLCSILSRPLPPAAASPTTLRTVRLKASRSGAYFNYEADRGRCRCATDACAASKKSRFPWHIYVASCA